MFLLARRGSVLGSSIVANGTRAKMEKSRMSPLSLPGGSVFQDTPEPTL
jgi:hypothetical protein